MLKPAKTLLLLLSGVFLICCVSLVPTKTVSEQAPIRDIASLGEALFFDTNLSKNRSQSCSSCHAPERAFTDGRDNGIDAAVSLGDDGVSLGDRHAPTLTYAYLTPVFHRNEEAQYVGGLFHDGRAATLIEQAAGPPLNPLEMGMINQAAVMERIHENPTYVQALKKFYGDSIFDDADKLYRALCQSIAAFETGPQFAPFDSKYDRYLRGEYVLTKQQELGRQFFFSDLVNCSSCHLLNLSPLYTEETFTNYRYHNIGVPVNVAVRKKNGVDIEYRDRGLLENPAVVDPAQSGKFKTTTLRNVAVTAPYMHNGIFKDLRTVLIFYSKYLVSNEANRTNPETGQAWGEAEITETIDLELLQKGQPLDSNQITALLAFLEALTDKRYEYLLEE